MLTNFVTQGRQVFVTYLLQNLKKIVVFTRNHPDIEFRQKVQNIKITSIITFCRQKTYQENA